MSSAIGSCNVSPQPIGLYVHVPFCVTKCTYCDFYSVPACGGDEALSNEVYRYLDALELQIAAAARDLGSGLTVPTLYFGGGTPSVLGEHLSRVIGAVRKSFILAPDAEVTVEVNPDDITPDLLARYAGLGVSRISVGIQSLDDEVLHSFGRRHDAAGAREALRLLADSGFAFSADLICGVPGQSDQQWEDTLLELIRYHPDHVSIYPLSVEEHTPLAVQINAGQTEPVDPDVAATHMEIADRVLAQAGIPRYEVSNYARPGAESRHNTSYWTGVAYLGFGPGAASMLPLEGGGRVRFALHESIEAFIQNPVPAETAEEEYLSAEESAREDAMLGLRLSAGIDRSLIERAGAGDAVERLIQQGLIAWSPDGLRVSVTHRGWLLGNEVFEAVLLG